MILTKPQLRKTMRQLVGAMTTAERAAADASICKHLSGFIKKNCPGLLLAFFPSGHEPDIRPVISEAQSTARRVALPVSTPDAMSFRQFCGRERLCAGPWAIAEPDAVCPAVGAEEMSSAALLLVPGLAFTRGGERLGRGGGHYDRFLAFYPDVCSVGVCYGVQVVEQLPAEQWDRAVRWLCTEQGVVRAADGISGQAAGGV